MKKFLCNLLIIFVILFISEIITYYITTSQYMAERNTKVRLPFKYNLHQINDKIGYYYCDGSNNCNFKIRQPEGLNYKNKPPIIIFGCSFAHGTILLNRNQTIGSKLSKITKRPVYNRGIQGGGLADMYWQTTEDDFYKEVPIAPPMPDTIIYIMIPDHYRRMYSLKFHPAEYFFNRKYIFDKKTGKFKKEKINFFKDTFIFSCINSYFIKKYVNNPKNFDKVADDALLYFLKSREELQKHYNNKLKFIVVFYPDYQQQNYFDSLNKKLTQNGFLVFNLYDYYDKDISSNNTEYIRENHPTEKVWDIFTPILAKEFNL